MEGVSGVVTSRAMILPSISTYMQKFSRPFISLENLVEDQSISP